MAAEAAHRSPRSRYRAIRGLRYHFHCWGSADAEPVFMLHGWMDCGRTFQFVVDALSLERFVIAPDWRGFGRTDWAQGGYWFPDYLADLDRILDAFRATAPVDLVGHSMGGNVACLYSGIRSERVRRLVSLEGFGLLPASPEDAPGRYRRWLEQLRTMPEPGRYESFQALADQLCSKNARLPPQQARLLARSLGKRGSHGVELRADPRHRIVNPVLYRIEEAEACWRASDAPVLFMAGAQSRYLDYLSQTDLGTRYAKYFTRLEIELVEDAGHMLHHDQPSAVARVLQRFLA